MFKNIDPKFSKNLLIAGLTVVLAVLIGILWGLYSFQPSSTQNSFEPHPASDDSNDYTASLGGPFKLTTHTGQAFTEKNLLGRISVLAFGFTHCPDICPGMLQTMMLALDSLPPDQQEKIQPIFITIDPARDTVPVMADYVKNFSARLVGLTGTADEIGVITSAYKVYSRKIEEEAVRQELSETGQAVTAQNIENYLMDHTSLIYVVNAQGKVVRIFSHKTEPERVGRFLLNLVQVDNEISDSNAPPEQQQIP